MYTARGWTAAAAVAGSMVGALALWPRLAEAQLTPVGEVKIVCPGATFTYKEGLCVAEAADLKKLASQAQCKGPGLKWVPTQGDPNKGECAVDKAPTPVCSPDAWNIVYKDKKCLIDGDPQSTKSKEFFADWAIGIAVVKPRVRTITDAAIVPAAAASGATPTVRVNSEVKYESSMLVARHFYPWNPGRRCAQGGRFSTRADDEALMAPVTGFFASCAGAMVAVGLPTSGAVNGQVINFAGFGLALGSGPSMEDNPLAWHFGYGWGRKFNARVLGDGWTENAAPPPGETQVRYKNIDVAARFLYFTLRW